MFPLDRDFLLLVKFFVVLTCVFFWIRLIYLALSRRHNINHRRYEE